MLPSHCLNPRLADEIGFIQDLRGFQDNATPIQTRFLRLSQDVDAFRSNLKDVFALENKSEVEEIDRQIQELRAELFR